MITIKGNIIIISLSNTLILLLKHITHYTHNNEHKIRKQINTHTILVILHIRQQNTEHE